MTSPIDDTDDAAARSAPNAGTDADRWRGWFYRAIATDPDAPVLQYGAPFMDRWFAEVENGAIPLGKPSSEQRYAMVVLHATLAGCSSVGDALRGAHMALRPGGVAVLALYNSLRRSAWAGVPAATPWALRRAAFRAGFGDTKLFLARPDLDTFDRVVSAHPRSARAFFCFDVAVRHARGRIRAPRLRSWLASFDVPRWLEPCLVVVAHKC